MTYRILWLQSALDELTEIWINAPSQLRKAITKASRSIDTDLVVNPETNGESRPEGRRVEFFPPLGVIGAGMQHVAELFDLFRDAVSPGTVLR